MSKPRKHSVAVIVSNGLSILAIRRPDDDDELPGIWGLPAGTCVNEETVADVIMRIGREKLGVELKAQRQLHFGQSGSSEISSAHGTLGGFDDRYSDPSELAVGAAGIFSERRCFGFALLRI